MCVCKQKEEEEDITDRQRSETRLYYPETKESQHSHVCMYVRVCEVMLNSYFSVPTPAVSQQVITAQHFLKTSRHSGKLPK